MQAESAAEIENMLSKKKKEEDEDKSKLIPKSTLEIAHAIKSCEAESCGQVLNPCEKHRFVLNTKTNELREVDKDAKKE